MKDTNTLKITTKFYGNKSRMMILFQLFIVHKADGGARAPKALPWIRFLAYVQKLYSNFITARRLQMKN